MASHLRLRAQRHRGEGQNRALNQSLARLKAVQQMQESLTASIIHDLRSPLVGVQMALEMAEEDFADTELDARESLQMATQSSVALTEMVNDLLSISKLEAAQMPLDRTRVSVAQIWQEARASLGGLGLQHALVFECDDDLSCVCDAPLIRRTLVNLVHNAIQHSPTDQPILVRARAEDSHLRIEVHA